MVFRGSYRKSKCQSNRQSDICKQGCAVCSRVDSPEAILLCDGCDAENHMHCLIPPLSKIPKGRWFCWNCKPLQVRSYTHIHLYYLYIYSILNHHFIYYFSFIFLFIFLIWLISFLIKF